MWRTRTLMATTHGICLHVKGGARPAPGNGQRFVALWGFGRPRNNLSKELGCEYRPNPEETHGNCVNSPNLQPCTLDPDRCILYFNLCRLRSQIGHAASTSHGSLIIGSVNVRCFFPPMCLADPDNIVHMRTAQSNSAKACGTWKQSNVLTESSSPVLMRETHVVTCTCSMPHVS